MSGLRRITLLAAAALAVALPAGAEVSVIHDAAGGVTLFFEPSATGPWARVREDLQAHEGLNLQGDARGDAWPVIRTNPVTGFPDVAWSTPGDAGDVRFSWNDSATWRAPLNVSDRAGADHAVDMADDQYGNRFVAWNNERSGHAVVIVRGVRQDGGAMSAPVELTPSQREGRRPAIAIGPSDAVFVSFEEQVNGNDGDAIYVAIDRLAPQRGSAMELLCSGENTADLSRTATIRTALVASSGPVADSRVDSEDGHLWVTWIDSRTRVGWVEWNGTAFSDPQYRPFDRALGYEGIRREIREDVLNP